MQAELLAMGIDPGTLAGVYGLIDRRDKMTLDAWEKYGLDLGLKNDQLDDIKELIQNQDLWKRSETLQRFFKAVDAYGVTEYVRYAPHVIRGLDYYTGTVFEAWDTAGDFRAIFGGGRYDDLVNAVGGEPVPAVGFAVGNVVVSLLLAALGHTPELGGSPAPIYMTVFDEERLVESLRLAAELRQSGLKVSSHLQAGDKLQKQFKQADRVGARLVLVLGPDEISKGEVSVKDLASGDQRSVKHGDLAKELNGLLG
jgi:histidyl-tRNA synthetase